MHQRTKRSCSCCWGWHWVTSTLPCVGTSCWTKAWFSPLIFNLLQKLHKNNWIELLNHIFIASLHFLEHKDFLFLTKTQQSEMKTSSMPPSWSVFFLELQWQENHLHQGVSFILPLTRNKPFQRLLKRWQISPIKATEIFTKSKLQERVTWLCLS